MNSITKVAIGKSLFMYHFYHVIREKVKQEEMNEKASLLLQAKDEELSVLKLVSINNIVSNVSLNGWGLTYI